MLREYTAELKNYNFYEDFKKGYYLDALDEHRWKVAQIKDITKYGLRTTVEVHFDGYNIRYDSKYDLPSSHKLAPFRTHTLPYTGPNYQPKRQQIAQKQTAVLLKQLGRWATIKEERARVLWINQVLRGELFLFVDYLITRRSYEGGRESDQAVNFIVAYIKEGGKILNESADYLKELEKEASYDCNLSNVHPKIALIHANTEFLFVLNTLVGNKDGRAEIYKHFQGHSVTPGVDLQRRIRQVVLQCKIVQNCNRFMEFKSSNGRGLPWSIKKEVVLLLNFMTPEGYALPIPTDNREYIEILDYMGYFSLKGLLTREQEQKKTLQLIVSLIVSGNFQGRLRGLNEMKRLMDYQTARRKDVLNAEITSKDLLNFLIENKNFNPEMFKRSLAIFEYCYRNNMLGVDHLRKILTLHRDKHELEIKGFYSSLAEFAVFLDPKTVVSFFNMMVKTLPQDEYLITLAKDYTTVAITKNAYFRASYCKEGEELALGFYWGQITSESGEIASGLRYKAIECFAALLSDLYYSKEIDKYISLSVKSIASRKNLQFYFKIIHETLKLSKGPRIAKSIEAVQKQVNIVDCVIEGLQASQQGNKPSQKMWECMFEFLQQVTYVSRKKLSFVQARQFWKIRECHKYFLKFLRKYRLKKEEDKSWQKIVYKQLPSETMKELLEKIFLDGKEMEDFQNVGADLYQTVDELLMAYNNNTGLFEYNYKHTIRVRNPERIFGLEFYFNILNNGKNRETVEKAGRRLIEICLRALEVPGKNLQPYKLNNWNFLLERLSKLKRNVLFCYRILLEELNGRMKSLNILQPDLVTLMVKNKATGVIRVMHVPRCSSLWKFRYLIAEEFRIEGLSFDMHLLSNSTYKETDFMKEEDFSMALITLNKDGPSVFINPTKNRHPHLEAVELFYKFFADSRGEQLLEWLSKEEGSQALKILQKLPFVKKLQEKITKLSFKDINEIMDSSSTNKLSYQLKILNNEKSMKLTVNMVEKGFIDHIAKIVLIKRAVNTVESYAICVTLMSMLIEILKFVKSCKNPVMFSDTFMFDLLASQEVLPCNEYEEYLVKCVVFYRDMSVVDDGNRKKVVKLFEAKLIDKTIEAVLFSTSREKIGEILLDIVTKTKTQGCLLQIVARLLRYQTIKEKQLKCKHLFDVLSLLVERKMVQTLADPIKALFRAVRKADIMEQSEQTENTLLAGVMGIILKLNKSLPSEIEGWLNEKAESYINHIISDCLFSTQPNKLRFKSPGLRSLGFKFLQQFAGGIGGRSLSSAVSKAMRSSTSWRKPEQWNISVVKQVSHKYSGLKNLAATCYINSLLQQLFFIDSFSSQIINLEANKIEEKENIALELQNIFGHLKFSESPVYTTDSLCKTFILDGQPIDPRIQTDVDEFFHSLMDKLERNLSKIGKKDIINNIFGGELSNLIIGSQCEHTSERIQPFLSIRLEIKDKKSLEEALREFIKGEVLEGDNAYFCEKCDAKIKAVKRVCLKTLPQILIMTLKRFQFDFETMEKLKLNSYCSFPEVINVLPYTRDGIDNDHDVDARLYEYRLKGVVIHYGISQAGHYTSYVQTQTQGWQYFDDEKISEFNGKQLGLECFGGIEQNPFGDDEQKKKNAYLLFYQKVAKSNVLAPMEMRESAIFKQINEENMRHKLMNLLFEPNMQNFMLEVGGGRGDPRVFMSYFYLVFLRNAKKRDRIEAFYSCAQGILQSSRDMAVWQMSQITDNFLNEFVFYAETDVRHIVTGLILVAFRQAPGELTQALLQLLICQIGKRNMYPMVKVFALAAKNKALEKYMKEIGLPEYIYQQVRSAKDSKLKIQSEIRPRKGENDLGSVSTVFADRPYPDQIDLLQAIEGFKINFNLQDLQLLLKRLKRSRSQQSLAVIMARRFTEMEMFVKLQPYLVDALCKMECSWQEEHMFHFYILLVEQLAKINDQFTSKRVERLASIYMMAMRESLTGYRALLMLLFGLFRISASCVYFRDRVSDQFDEKEGKKLLKDVKNWIKEVGANLSSLLKFERMYYWRKGKFNIAAQTMNYLIENEDKLNVDKFQSCLNSIVEKHQLVYTNGEERQFVVGDLVKYNRITWKVTRCYGLLAEIETAEKRTVVPLEDLLRTDYFC